MSAFLGSQDSLWPQLQALTHDSLNRLWMAVAYWGRGAEVMLDIKRQRGSFRLICDLYSGSCNPETIDVIRQIHPGGVKYLNGLHAKVYLGDKAAIVGSANASAAGTGWEGAEAKSLMEAAIKVESVQTLSSIAEWMDGLWSVASEVKSRDIKAAMKIWRRQRATRSAAPAVSPAENAIGRRILVVWENLEQTTKKEKATFDRWKSARKGEADWDFFSDSDIKWIPDNATLLFVDTGKRTFTEGVRATFDCVPFPLLSERVGRAGFVVPVKPQKTVDLGGKPFQLTSDIRRRVWLYVQEQIRQDPTTKSGEVDLEDVLNAGLEA